MNLRKAAIRLAVVVFSAAWVSSGCYSMSPLDPDPALDLDRRLLGDWRCVSFDADAPGAALVTIAGDPDQEREYAVSWRENDGKTESYRAFVSVVARSNFLNVRPAEEDAFFGGGWAFVRYALPRRNVLYLEMVREEIFRDEESSGSAVAARAALEAALEAVPEALKDYCVCARTVQER
jgi:hypothetical protein